MAGHVVDAVISYHDNPQTCGVTKFNIQLAKRLGVRHQPIMGFGGFMPCRHPLLSLKASELRRAREPFSWFPPYDVLWHDEGIPEISARADRVFYASEIGCPATIQGNATRPGLTLLTFGMAHKFQAPYFARLKEILDASRQPYHVCVSAAIHEGHPWDLTTAENEARMREVFGDHLRFLGFLADDALAREIRDAHLIALFYDPAARANNTTLWAALQVGTPVITNLDDRSPVELVHERSVFDIDRLQDLPDAPLRREVRFGGWQAASVYSWDRVIAKLTAPVHV